jgi:hypothetical protein
VPYSTTFDEVVQPDCEAVVSLRESVLLFYETCACSKFEHDLLRVVLISYVYLALQSLCCTCSVLVAARFGMH